MAPLPTVTQLYPFGMEMFSKSKDFTTLCFLKPTGPSTVRGTTQMDPWGNGTTTDQTSPIMVMDSNVSEFAAGSEHTLIVKTDGTLWGVERTDPDSWGMAPLPPNHLCRSLVGGKGKVIPWPGMPMTDSK